MCRYWSPNTSAPPQYHSAMKKIIQCKVVSRFSLIQFNGFTRFSSLLLNIALKIVRVAYKAVVSFYYTPKLPTTEFLSKASIPLLTPCASCIRHLSAFSACTVYRQYKNLCLSRYPRKYAKCERHKF